MEMMLTTTAAMLIGAGVVGVVVASLVCMVAWRVVVPTNWVHIVQSSRTTTSYGNNSEAGNTYYNIPAFLPRVGVTRLMLPINNFPITLMAYEAYDKDRAPFELDIVGFFVISDTNLAAARAASFEALAEQLHVIIKGAARTILARHDINEIMGDRAKFGDAFTQEVDHNLTAWGVKTVKSLELMDIRDAKGSKIIHDIMAKKASIIDRESRAVVADNAKQAKIAEIDAQQAVEIRAQEQRQAVGERQAQQEQRVGIAKEQAQQEVQSQAKVTKDREMDVVRVARLREAEIARDAAVVVADAARQSDLIRADAARQVAITSAEGSKGAMILNADGVRAEGEAKGAAEQALLLAPVNAQITLAEKIATLPTYQTYLVSVRSVEAQERIGIENAKALAAADIKIIATAGDASTGMASVSDVLGAKGGMQIGAMLEGLATTEMGSAVLGRLGVGAEPTAPVKPVHKPNGRE